MGRYNGKVVVSWIFDIIVSWIFDIIVGWIFYITVVCCLLLVDIF